MNPSGVFPEGYKPNFEAHMATIDIQNIYSGSLSITAQAWTGDTITTNATSYSTNVINHNPTITPASGNGAGAAQNFSTFGVGEPMSVVLVVTAQPGHAGTESYTVSLLTDTAANLTTAPVTLATLSIPSSTPANTGFILPLPANTAFLVYSGLKFVLANGTGTSSLNVYAYLAATNSIPNTVNYQSGWQIQNS